MISAVPQASSPLERVITLPIDFGSLGQNAAADTATEPQRIFRALPNRSDKYEFPRDVQGTVWQQWHSRRGERDLVIRMNTGGGKTVVGLLILKSCLNEGKGPAVYLTPDNYLAAQVRAEASELGIEVVEEPREARFQRGKAILVTNIKKLVNGRTQFGTAESDELIEIGSLLIDDAHAGVANLDDQFTLRVPREEAEYSKIVKLFETELRLRSANAFLDIEDRDWNAVLEVPFWLWADRYERVLDILHPARNTPWALFVWPLIKDCLKVCRVAITAREVEIAPPCPPIEQIPSLINAERRIYLTATLADDSVLMTHFGADPATVAQPITPGTAADLGDRMILAPLDTMSLTSGDEVKDFVAKQSEQRNVVVIVPSRRQARLWKDVADQVLDRDSIHEGVHQLRTRHVGLVVLINKYDGIDLPNDACRLLVLDGLPEVFGGLDRLEGRALGESEAISIRQIQRIEQGMGRGVRSANDHCVVLLLSAKLTQRLHGSGAAERFSPATRAQLRLSDRVADQLHGQPFTEFAAVVNQCLNRDPGWIRLSRNILDDVRYDNQRPLAALAHAQRRAFEAAASGQLRKAADLLQAAVDEIPNDKSRLKGWFLQQVAAYRHHDDAVLAQRTLASGFNLNKNILRPRDDIPYKRLKAYDHQATSAAHYLEDRYQSPEQLMNGFNAILEDLVPDPENTDSFEQAWADLGQHLGFATERPEKEIGNGPDDLWALGEQRFLLTECKSGTTTATAVARKDVEQLSHSVDWFIERYGDTRKASALLIHKSRTPAKDASPRQGARLLTFDRLEELRDAVRKLAHSLTKAGSINDKSIIAQQLKYYHLTGKEFVQHWTTNLRSS